MVAAHRSRAFLKRLAVMTTRVELIVVEVKMHHLVRQYGNQAMPCAHFGATDANGRLGLARFFTVVGVEQRRAQNFKRHVLPVREVPITKWFREVQRVVRCAAQVGRQRQHVRPHLSQLPNLQIAVDFDAAKISVEAQPEVRRRELYLMVQLYVRLDRQRELPGRNAHRLTIVVRRRPAKQRRGARVVVQERITKITSVERAASFREIPAGRQRDLVGRQTRAGNLVYNYRVERTKIVAARGATAVVAFGFLMLNMQHRRREQPKP